MRHWKKLLTAGLGASAAVGIAFAVLPGASASAATTTATFTLCAHGGYDSYLVRRWNQ